MPRKKMLLVRSGVREIREGEKEKKVKIARHDWSMLKIWKTCRPGKRL